MLLRRWCPMRLQPGVKCRCASAKKHHTHFLLLMRRTSVEEPPVAVQATALLTQCKSSSYRCCCHLGVPCDCSQGSSARWPVRRSIIRFSLRCRHSLRLQRAATERGDPPSAAHALPNVLTQTGQTGIDCVCVLSEANGKTTGCLDVVQRIVEMRSVRHMVQSFVRDVLSRLMASASFSLLQSLYTARLQEMHDVLG